MVWGREAMGMVQWCGKEGREVGQETTEMIQRYGKEGRGFVGEGKVIGVVQECGSGVGERVQERLWEWYNGVGGMRDSGVGERGHGSGTSVGRETRRVVWGREAMGMVQGCGKKGREWCGEGGQGCR